MTPAVDEQFEEYLSRMYDPRPVMESQRRLHMAEYEREQMRVERGEALFRLKDVKEYWALMMCSLPRPVLKTDFPWLFSVDWHFESFLRGLDKHGARVPKDMKRYLLKASERARQLFAQNEIDAALNLMTEVWNVSWTKKTDIEKLAKLLDD